MMHDKPSKQGAGGVQGVSARSRGKGVAGDCMTPERYIIIFFGVLCVIHDVVTIFVSLVCLSMVMDMMLMSVGKR